MPLSVCVIALLAVSLCLAEVPANDKPPAEWNIPPPEAQQQEFLDPADATTLKDTEAMEASLKRQRGAVKQNTVHVGSPTISPRGSPSAAVAADEDADSASHDEVLANADSTADDGEDYVTTQPDEGTVQSPHVESRPEYHRPWTPTDDTVATVSERWVRRIAEQSDLTLLVNALKVQEQLDDVARDNQLEGIATRERIATEVDAAVHRRNAALDATPEFWYDAMRGLPSHAMYVVGGEQQRQTLELHETQREGGHDGLGYTDAAYPRPVDDEQLLKDFLERIRCTRVRGLPTSQLPVCDDQGLLDSRCLDADEAGGTPNERDGDYFRLSFSFRRKSTTNDTFPFRFRRLIKYTSVSRAHFVRDHLDPSLIADMDPSNKNAGLGHGSIIDWARLHDSHDPTQRVSGRKIGGVTGSFFSLFPEPSYYRALPPFHRQQLRARLATMFGDMCGPMTSNPIALLDQLHLAAKEAQYIHHDATPERLPHDEDVPDMLEEDLGDPYENRASAGHREL